MFSLKRFFVVFMILIELNHISEGFCQIDTHIQCGELLVWNDTLSPKTTVFEMRLSNSESLPDNWSVYISTCHENTTASTTLKLFDHCPIHEGRHPKSAIATNSRDRTCEIADRSSTLEYFSDRSPQKPHSLTENKYYVAVTAGAASHGPEEGVPYRVGLYLSCRDAYGAEFQYGFSQNEHDDDDATTGYIDSKLQRAQRAVNQDVNSKGNIRFSRRLTAVTSSPTLSLPPTLSPSISTNPTITSHPTALPSSSSSPLPTESPTGLPSIPPTLEPSTSKPSSPPSDSPTSSPTSTAPTTLPTPSPTSPVPSSVPSSNPTPLPSITSLPSPVPTIDICKHSNLSCGSIVAGNTTGQHDFMGAVAGELMFLMNAVSARRLRLTVCPTDSFFSPSIRIYDGCPNEGGTRVASSNRTNETLVMNQCAYMRYDINDGDEGEYWVVVDGAVDGSQGAFELTTTCESLEPSPLPSPVPIPAPSQLPSPAPTSTPLPSQVPVLAPTPLPTTPPTSAPTAGLARENCACFSENMIINIEAHCPHIAPYVNEGCMSNVTRATLTELSLNCTALKADWGPFFKSADDDYGTVPGYPTYD